MKKLTMFVLLIAVAVSLFGLDRPYWSYELGDGPDQRSWDPNQMCYVVNGTGDPLPDCPYEWSRFHDTELYTDYTPTRPGQWTGIYYDPDNAFIRVKSDQWLKNGRPQWIYLLVYQKAGDIAIYSHFWTKEGSKYILHTHGISGQPNNFLKERVRLDLVDWKKVGKSTQMKLLYDLFKRQLITQFNY